MTSIKSWHPLRSLLAAMILTIASSTLASAQYTAANIYTFPYNGNEAFPSSLIMDATGNLYGTTQDGGSCSNSEFCGTVFELSPVAGGGWTETTLWSNPNVGTLGSALVMDAAGNLYGVIGTGGNTAPKYCDPSCGSVFELSPGTNGWTFTEIFGFHGNDGAAPVGALVFDAAGNLYGVTNQGGTPGWGTVYQLTPGSGGWTHKVLHFFNNTTDGKRPESGLTIDATGNLYGTAGGGLDNDGVVFKLALGSGGNYGFQYIHAFTGGAKGLLPAGPLLLDASGNIFGETQQGGSTRQICTLSSSGCGLVYELQKTATGYVEKTLHNFVANVDGTIPMGGLIADSAGNLYGTTAYGVDGQVKIYGTVFELSPSGSTWTETTLYVGTHDLGTFIPGGVVRDFAGNLYGPANTTSIFQLSPP
jgi:uncharacterized repeat protein (TIGR03803 family)